MTDAKPVDEQPQATLARDRAFWGVTSTQFLGSFNDNVFKQLVLLVCLDYKEKSGTDFQPLALLLFALPFVFFSGFAGWLSDRVSKRRIFILAKFAEVGVMLLAMAAFGVGRSQLPLLIALLMIVLFHMSTQSAFFGPAKYGILPELFREQDLPAANGVVQMTTFISIIFGMAAAGFAKDQFEGELWKVSAMCVGIGVVGSAAAFLIRRTAVARPGLPFRTSALVMTTETRKMLGSRPAILRVLIVSSVFWFLGGVVQPSVNDFGKIQMHYGDSRTSLAAACLGIGIAIGCILAGRLSRGKIDFRLTRIGAWGSAASLVAMSIVGFTYENPSPPPGKEAIDALLYTRYPGELASRIVLTSLGVFAGLFIVPLQVFLQARSPGNQKGRMMGAMNLVNWCAIVLSAVFYLVVSQLFLLADISLSAVFAVLSLGMVAIAVWFRFTADDARENEPPQQTSV